MEIADTAAIVTGGASGLGEATARMLRGRGARVTILDRDARAGEALADAIGARFVTADVTSGAAIADALEAAESACGVARILVNCAGIAPAMRTVGREAVPHDLDRFRSVVEVNLVGTFNVASKFAARLSLSPPLAEERGVIINTASVAAFEGQIGQAAYAASKGGVAAMTLPLARDLAALAIRVCTIAPGIFWTPMLGGLPQETQESLGAQVPFPSRLGRPDEFAALAEAIIGNSMLNGETIRLDGAIRMAPR